MNFLKSSRLMGCFMVSLFSAGTVADNYASCDLFASPLICLGRTGDDWLLQDGFKLSEDWPRMKYVSEPRGNVAGLYVEVTLDEVGVARITYIHTVSRYSMNVRDFSDFVHELDRICDFGSVEDARGVCSEHNARLEYSDRRIDLEVYHDGR